MNTAVAFQSWFEKELGKGLVDIKFAVLTGKGVSKEAIQSEVLVAENMLAANILRDAPSPKSSIPSEAISIFENTVLS